MGVRGAQLKVQRALRILTGGHREEEWLLHGFPLAICSSEPTQETL